MMATGQAAEQEIHQSPSGQHREEGSGICHPLLLGKGRWAKCQSFPVLIQKPQHHWGGKHYLKLYYAFCRQQIGIAVAQCVNQRFSESQERVVDTPTTLQYWWEKIKARESRKRNVLLLPVNESREKREFYCAFPSTKNIASAQAVGQWTRKVWTVLLPKTKESLSSSWQFSFKPFISSFRLSYHLEECSFLSSECWLKFSKPMNVSSCIFTLKTQSQQFSVERSRKSLWNYNRYSKADNVANSIHLLRIKTDL